jgi:hypothetical protein
VAQIDAMLKIPCGLLGLVFQTKTLTHLMFLSPTISEEYDRPHFSMRTLLSTDRETKAVYKPRAKYETPGLERTCRT